MAEYIADTLRSSFVKCMMFLASLTLSSCGLEPSIPSGGIVDNGNRPTERHKNETSSGDAKAQPSATTANDDSQQAPIVAYATAFDGTIRFQLPLGLWNKDVAVDLGYETWRSEAGHFVTFTKSDESCPTSATTTSMTNAAGTLVTRCNATHAVAKTSKGDILKIDDNLSDAEFDVIAKSLENDPNHL